jgi:2-keto-myo-inositol isomerase
MLCSPPPDNLSQPKRDLLRTNMKLSLNGATTMRANLETDLSAAQAAGFDYVEIWAAKLREYLKSHTTSDLKQLFVSHTLEPLSINSIEHITFRDASAYELIKRECEELCRIASEIDCPYVVVVPGRLPAQAVKRDEIISESVRVLNELADIAAKYDVSLAFEFLGQSDCSVSTLGLAHDIVKTLGRENVGLVIDSFHYYAGGSTIDMVLSLDPKLLYIFHLNDAEDLPREQLEDRHRLLPGLGILPLAELASAFNRIGYDGVASVEIFRPEYWDMDPTKLACEAGEATRSILTSNLSATR